METAESEKKPRTARIAGVVAIAAWPVGLLLGVLFSAGQDAPGAAMAQGLGFAAAAMVSLAAGGVYLFARSPRRLSFVARHRGKLLLGAAGAVLWIAARYWLPPLGTQYYGIHVSNQNDTAITDVSVAIGAIEARFSEIDAQSTGEVNGFTGRPAEPVVLTWVDAAARRHERSSPIFADIPRRYDGGNVVLTVFSGDRLIVTFLRSQE